MVTNRGYLTGGKPAKPCAARDSGFRTETVRPQGRPSGSPVLQALILRLHFQKSRHSNVAGFFLVLLQPLHNGAALAFTPSVCYYIPQRQISTGDQLWKVNREIRKSAGQKIGIAKQSCFRSPPGTRMNQAKSNAILFVSSAKMTRISL